MIKGTNRKTFRFVVLLAVIAMLATVSLPALLRAQGEFSLRWGNVSGGYGISGGDGYRIAATSGEAAAGSMSGDGLRVSSGFWGAVDEPPPWVPPSVAQVKLFLPAAISD